VSYLIIINATKSQKHKELNGFKIIAVKKFRIRNFIINTTKNKKTPKVIFYEKNLS
jgi:ribosome-binding factor A